MILFDLVYPFKTLIEKQIKFDEVKEGIFPDILKEFDFIYHLLVNMINNNPESRLEVKDIVIKINQYTIAAKNCLLKKTFRERFLSEDQINNVKSYNMMMKVKDEKNKELWKNM